MPAGAPLFLCLCPLTDLRNSHTDTHPRSCIALQDKDFGVDIPKKDMQKQEAETIRRKVQGAWRKENLKPCVFDPEPCALSHFLISQTFFVL